MLELLHCSENRRSIVMQCLVLPIRSAPGKMQDARSMTNREVAVVIVCDQLIVLWPLLVVYGISLRYRKLISFGTGNVE